MGASPRRRMRRLALAALASRLAIALGLRARGHRGRDAFTPEAGPSDNAQDRHALQDRVRHRPGGDRAGLGRALLLARPLPGPPRAPRAAGPRQRAARAGLDDRRRGADRLDHRADHAAHPARHQEPAPSGPASLAEARAQNAAIDQPPPPGRQGRSRSRSRASSTSGATSTRTARSRSRTWSCPKDTTVLLDIKANDVAHSWWIPKLGGKVDAIPGSRTRPGSRPTEDRHLRGSVRRALRRRPRVHDARR